MKKILFPTDFSERAMNALSQAIYIAREFDYEILIYHVYHRPTVEGHTSEQLSHLKQLEATIDSKFEEILKQNGTLKHVKYEFRKELGLSVDKIIDTSKKEQLALIMMATKGAKGLGEIWGTKTAKIVKSVDVPVLVIPDNTSLENISKVGLTCDYSGESHYHSLDFLVEVVEKLNLDIDMITLNRSEKVMTQDENAYRLLVRKKLESVQTSFHFSFHSDVNDGIIDYSKNNNIGLIAMMPKSYSFIERLFHESITEKMIFSCPIPLLILK